MPSRIYQLSGSQSIQDALPFIANGIAVDNPGGQWVYLPDSDVYVSPFTIGYTAPLPAVTVGRAAIQAPPGQQNTGSGSPASITFTSEQLTQSPGQSVGGLSQGTGVVVAAGQKIVPGAAGSSWTIDSGVALAQGTVWRLALLTAYAIPFSTATPGAACWWQIGIGATVSPFFAFGPMAAGAGSAATGDRENGILWIPAADARPAVTQPNNANTVQFQVNRADTTWAANALSAGFFALLVPATL